MRLSGKGARRKGLNFERYIANKLKGLDPTAKRVFENQNGLGYDISTKLPFKIQCKCGKNVPVLDAIDEAEKACDGEEMPVAALKYTNSKFSGKRKEYILMRLDDWIKLLEKSFVFN